MIHPSALQLLLMALAGWLDRREREALAYLIEESRVLRRQLSGQRLRLEPMMIDDLLCAPSLWAVERWARLRRS